MFPIRKSAKAFPVETGDVLSKYKVSAQIRVRHLVLLGVHEISAEDELVLAQAHGDIVTIGECRI